MTIGFIPAFLAFSLRYDWWVLKFGGAFIWFGITGVRNILQSILGGGAAQFAAFGLERLRKLGADQRFAALHGFFRSAARLGG